MPNNLSQISWLKEIFQYSSVGFGLLNSKFELLHTNEQFEHILGPINVKQSIANLIPQIKLQRLENVIVKNRPYRLSIETQIDGKTSHVNIFCKLLPKIGNADSHIIFECLVDNSRTELNSVIQSFEALMKKSEQQVQQLNQQKEMLSEAVKSKMELISSMNLELEEKVKERTQELALAKKELAHQAQHDVLTGLPNRRLFNDRILDAIHIAKCNQNELAVLYLDLDKFKQVNDKLGHHIGDTVLIQVAKRLNSILKARDIIARMGGDEFAIIIEGADKPMVANIAQRINVTIAKPFVIDNNQIEISACIGVCMFDAVDNEEVRKIHQASSKLSINQAADLAMYEVKALGGDGYTFFSPQMFSRMTNRITMESSLKRAIESDQLVLHYQPKMNLQTGELSGCEALVRWQHPERGLLYPDEFIPLAEETGLINDLGFWVMTQAFSQLKDWRARNVAIPSIAINFSGKQLGSDEHQDEILNLLALSEIPPPCLEFELTESVLMSHKSSSGIQFLKFLGQNGYSVSMDDFGTGYSSLNYLRYIPINTLKIDRSFIANMMRNEQDKALVLTIIAIAKTMGLKIVAEGIEDAAQLDFLHKHDCDEGQGYYFSKPVSAKHIERFSKEHKQNPELNESNINPSSSS